MWSRALNLEMKSDGHDVQVTNLVIAKVVTPGANRTEKDLAFDTCMPDTMARASLHKLGAGHSSVVPWLPHALFLSVLDVTPVWVQDKIMSGLIKEQLVLNKAAGKQE
jgi:short-subunit dehydrogenase